MEIEKKYFEGLNADDDINLLTETDYINAENFRIGTTDVGSAMRLESVGGTIQLDAQAPAINESYIPLCAVEDEERRRILYFQYYTQGTHQIRCQDRTTGLNYTVLTQAQADLDFSKNNLIQAKIYGDLLFYTDDKQEIKVINIEAGIKANHPSYVTSVAPYIIPTTATPTNPRLAYEDITLLRRPPIYAPEAKKFTDGAYTLNSIKEQAFMFNFRYYYRDFQYSVLGLWSKLETYNDETTTFALFNCIQIKMTFLERIPQTVDSVELLVKNMDTGSVQAMKVWDKDIANDLLEINAHNAGTTQLTYNFYNNKAGLDVPPIQQSKHEENIPRWCKTLDTARKRLFLANYLQGFNSPLKTSLTLSIVDATTGTTLASVPVQLWHITYVQYTPPHPKTFRSLFAVKLTSIGTPGWYILPGTTVDDSVTWPTLIAPPASISFAVLIYVGVNENDVYQHNILPGHACIASETSYAQYGGTTTINITDIAGEHTRLFKTNSSFQLGIAFHDRLKRKIGMFSDARKFLPFPPAPTATTPNPTYGIVTIPDRIFTGTVFKNAIGWTLSNADAVNEIPKEAYYYSIVITKNLRTRYFVQTFVDGLRYALKKPDDGVIVVDVAAGSPAGRQYVAIDLASLVKDGMGWSISPGDLVRVYPNGTSADTPRTLAVVGQQGRYLLCEFFDFGTFTDSMKMIVEIYVPYKPSEQEWFYEVGNMYRVTLPGDPARTYSELTGTIRGDVHLLERKSAGLAAAVGVDYFAEGMSNNDKFWQAWWTDAGRAWENLRNKEIRKPYSIAFSAVYVIGTQLNGLSAFEAFDVEDVSPECGAIQKLLLTSKVQDDGTVMLVICYAETNTLYLGEAQISESASTAFFVKSVGVIGSINALRGSYGTQNAESVVLHRGQAYWYDAANGCFVRYDVNGLFPISEYKMKRVAKLFGDKYLSMTQADIEALGSRPFIFGGVDPHHNEVMWAIPKMSITPPKGYLKDYSVTYVNAIGKIDVTNVGNNGDKIEVFVFDPDYGKISLGFYIKQSTDTTVTILATSIKNVLAANTYGYVVTNVAGLISITARPNLGEIMNIGNRLVAQLTPVGVTITWNGLNPFCVQDAIGNTGAKRYLNRERLLNGVADGYTEPNAAGADYVPDVTDIVLCPIAIPPTNFLMVNATDRVLVNSVDKVKI